MAYGLIMANGYLKLRKKTLAIYQQFAKFTDVLSCQCFLQYSMYMHSVFQCEQVDVDHLKPSLTISFVFLYNNISRKSHGERVNSPGVMHVFTLF